MTALKVFIGYDGRQDLAYQICRQSMLDHASAPLAIEPLVLGRLAAAGLYTRPTETRDNGQLWDVISDAPMSTEFALTRFLVPVLAGFKGWALFCDADFLWRSDVARVFTYGDPFYAVHVVHHHYEQAEGLKMDGRIQTTYARKNHSSLMLFNCEHEATRKLTVEAVNTWRGLALHQFAWAGKHEIGPLPFNFNWLNLPAAAVHFTFGMPDVPGYENEPYADEWLAYAERLKSRQEAA